MLWDTCDVNVWQEHLDGYRQAIEALNKDQLSQLDKWFFNELPSATTSREPPHMIASELVDLVRWKLARGKFRPRLIDYAKEHSQDLVRDVTEKAFKQLHVDDGRTEDGHPGEAAVLAALKPLTDLKGLGPATASAVLSALDDSVPFMSDETIAAACPDATDKNRYTVNSYKTVLAQLRSKAAELSGNGERKWSASEVERALYCQAARSKAAAKPAKRSAAGKDKPAGKKRKS